MHMRVYHLANLSIVLNERFSGMLALLKSNLNTDQQAMVVVSTGRLLVLFQVLLGGRNRYIFVPGSLKVWCR